MARISQERTELIVAELAARFPCYGKGSRSGNSKNPIANTLAEQPLQFAFGVKVEDVVNAVVELIPTKKQSKEKA